MTDEEAEQEMAEARPEYRMTSRDWYQINRAKIKLEKGLKLKAKDNK